MLGLLASTAKGATLLSDYGWEAVRRAHNEYWPVVVDDFTLSDSDGDPPSCSSSVSVLASIKSETVFNYYHPEVSVASQLQPSPSTSYGASPKDTASLGGYSDPGEVKSRSSTTESIEIPADPQYIVISVSENNSPREQSDSISQNESPPKPPPRRRSRNSSEVSNSEGYQTPPSPSGRLSESSSVSGKDETVIHGRSQSDPARPTANCVDSQDRDNQPTVKFRIGSRESESELSRDFLKEPVSVIRIRSNSADAARQYVSPSLKNQHGGSHESSQTSKSHSDSIQTDTSNTTTSGIGSCDSAGVGVQEPGTLSPIPSASSMATEKSQVCATPDQAQRMHPTDILRQNAKLRRIPSLKRGYSIPSFSSSAVSPTKLMTQSVIEGSLYTSPRDAQGYSALRELQRNRSIVGNMEAELIDLCMEEPNVTKTRSLLDFRIGRPRSVHFPQLQVMMHIA